PGGPGRIPRSQTRRAEQNRLILKAGAKRILELQAADLLDALLQVPGGPVPEEIMAVHTGAMTQEVTKRDAGVGQRIGQLEKREMFSDGVVPVEFAFI